MHIGEVAARTELSLRTLRHYDDIGLLRPTGRSEGGFRVYTEDDVEKILLIRRMKPLGFTLEEMSTALQDLEAVRRSAADRRGVADGAGAGRRGRRGLPWRGWRCSSSRRPSAGARWCASWRWPTSSSTCSAASSARPDVQPDRTRGVR